MDTKIDCQKISNYLNKVSSQWNGKEAILEMKVSDYPHWKQMEWIGFYFQYLCEKHLRDIFEFQTPRYGNVSFDGLYKIPFDFKAHAINTSSHQIIVNDREAISSAIKEYGEVGLILALGKVEYNDEERTFQQWHEQLKGGLSKYSKERIKRGAWSRLRKVKFALQQISFIQITDKTLVKCGSFQSDFRNSDGKPRRKKVLLDLEKIDEELVHVIEF
ncbi:MAG: hypothetical protein HZB79_05760 [Deltaproteobacteria bacterium]|nr:hypothetical protein [Deltaproteobacteria bacterium]